MNTSELILQAISASQMAYAPYSHYPVGAALLAEDGEIITGCNIENASYGLSNCAERTAIFKAISAGIRSFQAIAIVGGNEEKMAMPCGACRQVLSEFCPANMPVIVASLDGKHTKEFTLGELLPESFILKQ